MSGADFFETNTLVLINNDMDRNLSECHKKLRKYLRMDKLINAEEFEESENQFDVINVIHDDKNTYIVMKNGYRSMLRCSYISGNINLKKRCVQLSDSYQISENEFLAKLTCV